VNDTMKLKKIELTRQTNFILALLLIHFVFFGYLCNVYLKSIGVRVLFLYQVMFTPASYLSAVILGLIVYIMVIREHFFEYGIRNSIWLIPFIIIESWIWYWFIIERFDITIIGAYFLRVESYITILSLLGINILAAFLAALTKETYRAYTKKAESIKIKKTSDDEGLRR
jgi:hypothetical protein